MVREVSKSKEDILELWKDYDKCPDFTPVLIDLIDERDRLKERNKVMSESSVDIDCEHK